MSANTELLHQSSLLFAPTITGEEMNGQVARIGNQILFGTSLRWIFHDTEFLFILPRYSRYRTYTERTRVQHYHRSPRGSSPLRFVPLPPLLVFFNSLYLLNMFTFLHGLGVLPGFQIVMILWSSLCFLCFGIIYQILQLKMAILSFLLKKIDISLSKTAHHDLQLAQVFSSTCRFCIRTGDIGLHARLLFFLEVL